MDTSLAADLVREALRAAGCAEWEPGRRGFHVEGDPNGGWVVVTCSPGARSWRRRQFLRNVELQKYRDVISAAGFSVTDSPYVPNVLRVMLPPEIGEQP